MTGRYVSGFPAAPCDHDGETGASADETRARALDLDAQRSPCTGTSKVLSESFDRIARMCEGGSSIVGTPRGSGDALESYDTVEDGEASRVEWKGISQGRWVGRSLESGM